MPTTADLWPNLVDGALDILAARDVQRSPHAFHDDADKRDYLVRCRCLESALKRHALLRLIVEGGYRDELELADAIPACCGPDAVHDVVCPWCGLVGAHRYGLCWTRMSGDAQEAARAEDPGIGLYVRPRPYDGDLWPRNAYEATVALRPTA